MGFGSTHAQAVLPHHNGANVFIRSQPTQSSGSGNDYEHIVKGSVGGHNIIKYSDKTVDECKAICDGMSDCVAFEYGVAYGGSGGYKAKDCQPQSSADYSNCDGAHHNLDLYIKKTGTSSDLERLHSIEAQLED